MIYTLLVKLTVLLAAIYYFSVVIQILSNNKIKVTRRKITLKALMPFYYWIK